MKNKILKIIVAGLILFFVGDVQAQNRMGGQTNSSSSSSSAYSRSYYTNGMIGDAIIEADYDTRSIIVIADEETNKRIGEIIKSMDRPVPQVLIKVVFLEVTYNDDYDFGIEGTINADDGGRNGGIFETLFGLAAESRGGFYQLVENDIEVTLRAIAEVGKTEILSRPSVLTRNNQEAVINVGKRVPIVTNVRISDAGLQTNTVEYEDIGIILRVTPFITQDGLVEMILAPEISTLTDQEVQISETLSSPVFANRSADTVVVTPNGKTVVIGGMMEDNTIESERKIPVLGDIPILGMAFRRTITKKSKTELMIFLTPHVVESPASLVDLSEQEKNKLRLMREAFTEDQLEFYINEQRPAEIKIDNTQEDVKVPQQSLKRSTKRSSKGRPIRY